MLMSKIVCTHRLLKLYLIVKFFKGFYFRKIDFWWYRDSDNARKVLNKAFNERHSCRNENAESNLYLNHRVSTK